MPIVEIDTASLEIHHSFLLGAFRMDFNVILWTDDLKAAVVEDLEKLYGRDLRINGYHEPRGKLHLNLNQIQVGTTLRRIKPLMKHHPQYKKKNVISSLWTFGVRYVIIEHKSPEIEILRRKL